MNGRRHSLMGKFTSLFLVFALLLCLLISTVSYFSYRSSMLSHYGKYALGVGQVAATELDTAALLAYQESQTPDAAYWAIHEKLIDIRQATGVEYIYVQIPVSDDEVMYIFDALDTVETGEDPLPLGILDVYDDNFSTAKEAMASGQPTAGLEITHSQYGYLASAYVPLAGAAGTPVAYVGVDIRMDDIVTFLQRYLFFVLFTTVVLVAACFAVLLGLLRRSVLLPIATIAGKAEEFTGGGIEDEAFQPLEIDTQDEIGSLATSMNRMFDDIRDYTVRLYAETASKQRIEDDLKTARNIQESLLPKLFPPYLAYTDVEIFASMTPAANVSGDFYDCFPIDDHHIAFAIAEVKGQGVASALFMMVVHTLIKNRAVSGYSPREVFESMNRQLCENNQQGMTATAFLGIYDSRNNILSYVSAGHPAPILKRAGGGTMWLPVEAGPVLGAGQGAEYLTQVETMDPGDCLLLYTGGLVGARNTLGEPYGEKTLMELMKKVRLEALVPQQVVELVSGSVEAFTGGARLAADITLMLMRRL